MNLNPSFLNPIEPKITLPLQNIQTKPSNQNNHIKAVVLSIGPNLIIGSLGFVSNLIKSIWNSVQYLFASVARYINKNQFEIADKKLHNHMVSHNIISLNATPEEKQQALADLQKLFDEGTIQAKDISAMQKYNESKNKFENSQNETVQLAEDLRNNRNGLVQGLLTMIPFFGISLAATFRQATVHGIDSISINSLNDATEDLLEDIRKNVTEPVRFALFPLSGSTGREDEYDILLNMDKFIPLFKEKLVDLLKSNPKPSIAQIKKVFNNDFFNQIVKKNAWFPKNKFKDNISNYFETVPKHSLEIGNSENPEAFIDYHTNRILSYLRSDPDSNVQLQKVSVNRGDGKTHEISTHFLPSQSDNPTKKTMVLFPGNGMVGLDMIDCAKKYSQRGWNVVMVTIGGYPGSDTSVKTNELSTIQDVHAVLKDLENKGVNNIGLHGFSIGGTIAMHATQLSHNISHVIIDRSLTNGREVAANLLNNLNVFIPSFIVKVAFGNTFPPGLKVFGVKDKDGNDYYTDGMDNVAKAGMYQGKFLVIGADEDVFMGRDKNENKFVNNFSNDIFEANKKVNKNCMHFIAKNAEHNSPLNYVSFNQDDKLVFYNTILDSFFDSSTN